MVRDIEVLKQISGKVAIQVEKTEKIVSELQAHIHEKVHFYPRSDFLEKESDMKGLDWYTSRRFEEASIAVVKYDIYDQSSSARIRSTFHALKESPNNIDMSLIFKDIAEGIEPMVLVDADAEDNIFTPYEKGAGKSDYLPKATLVDQIGLGSGGFYYKVSIEGVYKHGGMAAEPPKFNVNLPGYGEASSVKQPTAIDDSCEDMKASFEAYGAK